MIFGTLILSVVEAAWLHLPTGDDIVYAGARRPDPKTTSQSVEPASTLAGELASVR